MADVLNNSAISFLAQYILGKNPIDPTPSLGLFVNNHAPVCTDTILAFTECTCGGYGRIVLVPGTWTVPAAVACVIECTYPYVEFVLTDNGGGQTIYGHFVIDTTSGQILWAGQWATSFAVPTGGGIVRVYPFYYSQQC